MFDFSFPSCSSSAAFGLVSYFVATKGAMDLHARFHRQNTTYRITGGGGSDVNRKPDLAEEADSAYTFATQYVQATKADGARTDGCC